MPRNNIAVFLLSLLLAGCVGPATGGQVDGDVIYAPQWARGFAITAAGDSSSVLTVLDPWQDASGVEMRLFLSRGGEQAPEGFEGAVVRAPLARAVCMSSSYVAFIDELGAVDAIKGVSGAGFIANDTVGARVARGEVRDVGFDAGVNYELVVSLRPDLVMIYGLAEENAAMTAKLDELGIPYIYIGEYVERSPLGKAEWLVAFGEMLGMREQAVERFGEIRDSYLATVDAVDEYLEDGGDRPEVMLNAPWRDTWFVPGDRSYMVRLIGDAGGLYVCRGDDSDRSRPIGGEAAFVYANRADVWLNPGQAATMRELTAANPQFASIPPVVNRRVYNSTKRTTPGGGSDFWESGAVRADAVLKDIVAILHPQLLPGHEFYYFTHLE